MSPNLTLIITMGVLFAAGVYLILERSLTRILIGILLMSNATGILFIIISGPNSGVPIVGTTRPDQMSDPLPQAMFLTAIVIGLGLTAFLLALAHRTWQLNRNDEVQDDIEDRRIIRLANRAEASSTYEADDGPDDSHEASDEVADPEAVSTTESKSAPDIATDGPQQPNRRITDKPATGSGEVTTE